MEANRKQPITIDAYIAGFPEETQLILQKVRKTIREAAPDVTEAISYGMPTFKLNGNLVHFAAYKHHIGFYPAPSGIERFKEPLSKYKSAKGSVQFQLNEPIPYALIMEIVAFRRRENKKMLIPKEKNK